MAPVQYIANSHKEVNIIIAVNPIGPANIKNRNPSMIQNIKTTNTSSQLVTANNSLDCCSFISTRRIRLFKLISSGSFKSFERR